MWKEQKSGTRGVAECVTDVRTTFWRLLWSITELDARQYGIYLFYIISKSLFYFKIFQHNAKAGLLHRLCPAFARKKAIWRDLWSFQNEAISLVAMRSKESWMVEKNRATVKSDSSVAPRWMKTYSESRIEHLEENAGKIKSVFVKEQPCEPKSLDVVLTITGVEKILSENLWLRST